MRTETAVALSAFLKKKFGSFLHHVVCLTDTRAHTRTYTHIHTISLALCGAVLILVTAEGLATRDSTGSNQRKPDFFLAYKGTDYLLYRILY